MAPRYRSLIGRTRFPVLAPDGEEGLLEPLVGDRRAIPDLGCGTGRANKTVVRERERRHRHRYIAPDAENGPNGRGSQFVTSWPARRVATKAMKYGKNTEELDGTLASAGLSTCTAFRHLQCEGPVARRRAPEHRYGGERMSCSPVRDSPTGGYRQTT